MSEAYAGTPTRYDGSIILMEDGDEADAASARVSLEEIHEGLLFVTQLVSPGGSGEIVERMAGVPIAGSNAVIFGGSDGDGIPTPRINCSGTFQFSYLLDLPHGSGLRQIRAYLYRDGTSVLSSVLIQVVRRDYATTSDTAGDYAFPPVETVLGSSSASPTAMTGGMASVSATFSAVTVDREDACDYVARVSGVVTGAGLGFVSFMPKVRQWVQLIDVDKGAA